MCTLVKSAVQCPHSQMYAAERTSVTMRGEPHLVFTDHRRAGSRGVGKQAHIPFSFRRLKSGPWPRAARNENGMSARRPTPLEPARSLGPRTGSWPSGPLVVVLRARCVHRVSLCVRALCVCACVCICVCACAAPAFVRRAPCAGAGVGCVGSRAAPTGKGDCAVGCRTVGRPRGFRGPAHSCIRAPATAAAAAATMWRPSGCSGPRSRGAC